MADAIPIGSVILDAICTHCGAPEMRRICRGFRHAIADSEGIYEQVYTTNSDGSMTVMPAAKRLRKTHTRTVPRTSPPPKRR